YLPFEALIIPVSPGDVRNTTTLADIPYLVKQFRVTYIPSASILVAQRKNRSSQRRKAQFPLVAFGDPIYRPTAFFEGPDTQTGRMAHLRLRGMRLSRLEFSGEEVHRIARIWGIPLNSPHINLRDRANVERARELDLSQYRILHFASHAVLGDEVRWGTQPALVLSQDSGEENNDGLLQFADILDLKLNAELVVLSACDTALGKLREGEGIVGLTRAFLYAGTSAVVVSLWKVEDQSTSLLMERFYQRLKQGESKAEALRQAKLEVLQATIDLKAIGRRQPLAAPFYWAPFILVGDWD
ncbi:MAG: CHAT domain-containing protein, partial [Nitrospinae bacterium]|nr:CHAT domain-containing protein [Nitrospinota bacterium]